MARENVPDVSSERFDADVIEKSFVVPVVVDFWAPWCSPCLALGPILEKVVREFKGKVVLAKVNVDTSPDLADAYGVRSIPNVKLFADGNVVGEFMGVIPESQVREFIQRAVPSGGEEPLKRAQELLANGQLKEAESLARKALQERPEHGAALEILAVAAMASGRVDEAMEMIRRLESPSKDIQFLAEGADFWRLCAKDNVEANGPAASPEDVESKMTRAACLASKGDFIQALDLLLDVVQANKSFRDGLPRKAMVSIFVAMGLNNPVVREYQSRLARLLF